MNLAKRILVLAPHTDDGELGCGATIALALEQGATVNYVAFSSAADSLPPGTPPDQLVVEVRAATQLLGIPPERLIVEDYTVRRLNEHRQQILERLIELRESLCPQLVFLPSRQDLHQDHATVTQEALRAFKHTTMLGYELPWNNLSFRADAFVRFGEPHLARKLEALRAYRTQVDRNYMRPEFTRALATVRGTQAGGGYAECFEGIRIFLA